MQIQFHTRSMQEGAAKDAGYLLPLLKDVITAEPKLYNCE